MSHIFTLFDFFYKIFYKSEYQLSDVLEKISSSYQ